MDERVRRRLMPSLVKGLPQRLSNGGRAVPMYRASVVITTNFGVMGHSENQTYEEIRRAAQVLQRRYFDKLGDSIRTIPFRAYGLKDFKAIAHQIMQNVICEVQYEPIACLEYPAALIDRVAENTFDNEVLRNKNGRGVKEELYDKLLSNVNDALLNVPRSAYLGMWGKQVYDLIMWDDKSVHVVERAGNDAAVEEL